MTARSKRRFLPTALAPAMFGLALATGCDNPGSRANNPCAPGNSEKTARVVASPCRPTRERQVAGRSCAKPQTVALNPCAVRNPCAVAAKPAINPCAVAAKPAALNPCAVAAKAPALNPCAAKNPCAATTRAAVSPCAGLSPRAARLRC